MATRKEKSLLRFTDKGIYCPEADIYIDPWRSVHKAVITHAHADHARPGHEKYLAHKHSVPILKHRLGDVETEGLEYGEVKQINGVRISLHPAGHVPGSSQVRVEHRGEVWVVSGDYKLADDGLSAPFEVVKCHTFITECTFGLPVFRWKDQHELKKEILDWYISNRKNGVTSVLSAYSLGKAQRIINLVGDNIDRIYTHGSIENMNQVIRETGLPLFPTEQVNRETPKEILRGAFVVMPPSAIASSWLNKFQPYSLGIASGWMALRGMRRRQAADRGFVISDHADWTGLNTVIRETAAERIIATHGYTDIFAEWLKERGLDASTERTEYEGESFDNPEAS